MPDRGDVRQAWRFVGAGFVLVAIGMFGLLAGLRFSGSAQDGNVATLRSEIAANRAVIASNLARIRQLEDDFRRQHIPIPPPTTTSTVRRSTTTQRRVRSSTSSTSSTTAPSPAPTTTTTTTAPCRANVAGICIGGRP